MFKKIYQFFNIHYHRRYHNQYEHAKKLFVFDLFLLAVAIVMLGSSIFFYFWNPGLTDQIDLKISLGDERIKSGEKIKLVIDYKNRSKYILNNATFGIHLPSGFLIDRDLTPTSTFSDQSTAFVPIIYPGAKGQILIYGYLWIPPKQEQKITAILSYTPENSKNKEQKLSDFVVNLPDSVLQSNLQITPTSFANAVTPFTLSLRNNSEQKLANLNIKLNFPGKINIRDEDVTELSLNKNEEKIITGSIVMPGKSGEYLLSATINNKFDNRLVELLDLQNTIKTFSPNIALKTEITDNLSYAQPDQTINASLNWQNNDQLTIENAIVRISFTAGVVDLKTTARENHFKLSGDSLIIDNSVRTALANVQHKSSDQFNFKIFLLPNFNLGQVENAHLEIKPYFSGNIREIGNQNFEIIGQNARLPLTTELKLKSQARYYSDDGDQLGRGPLPPKVAQTTKYWIFVQLNNTTNPVKNANLEITLPDYVTFTGKQSVTIGPALSRGGNKINWSYRELPANSQTGWYFEVAATPSSEMNGQNLNLVNNIKFNAVDKNTGKIFQLENGSVNNILPAADFGNQKSSVVKQ